MKETFRVNAIGSNLLLRVRNSAELYAKAIRVGIVSKGASGIPLLGDMNTCSHTGAWLLEHPNASLKLGTGAGAPLHLGVH